jgi:hypothetical protein
VLKAASEGGREAAKWGEDGVLRRGSGASSDGARGGEKRETEAEETGKEERGNEGEGIDEPGERRVWNGFLRGGEVVVASDSRGVAPGQPMRRGATPLGVVRAQQQRGTAAAAAAVVVVVMMMMLLGGDAGSGVASVSGVGVGSFCE